jgi:protein ImuB
LAFALARFGGGGAVRAGGGPEALGPLPVSALALEAETVEVLQDLGLKRVSQLMAAPRAALARRLGPELLERLDQALGARGGALAYRLEIPPYRVELRLAEPISLEDQVLGLVRRAAGRLSTRLEAEALGGRLFRLELHRVDGAVKRLETASSRPLRDPDRIMRLFAERVAALNDGLEADFGFDQLRLTAVRTEPLVAEATSLLDEQADAGDFAALADRLDARLGPGSVVRFTPAPETRLPEASARAVPFGEARPGAWKDQPAEAYQGVPLRPARLFSPPQPIEVIAEVPESPPSSITWRRLQRRIAAAEGPERLEPEWGRKGRTPRVRDYYRLEDEAGRRYWVFRSGRFGDTAPPRWFLHGLFA